MVSTLSTRAASQRGKSRDGLHPMALFLLTHVRRPGFKAVVASAFCLYLCVTLLFMIRSGYHEMRHTTHSALRPDAGRDHMDVPGGHVHHRRLRMEHRSIPKIIHQTWKTSAESWKTKNPGYTYKLHTDADIDNLIHTHHPELISVYNRLAPVMKADLFRYLILHHEGGYYADVDVECLQPIDTWLLQSHDHFNVGIMIGFEIITGKRPDWRLWFARQFQMCQWSMASVPGHAILGHTIDHIIDQFEGKTDEELQNKSAVTLTGPGVWTDAVTDFLHDEYNVTFGQEPFTHQYLSDNFVHIGDVLLLPMRSFAVGSAGYVPDGAHMKYEEQFIRHGFLGSWKKKKNPAYDTNPSVFHIGPSCETGIEGARICSSMAHGQSPVNEGQVNVFDLRPDTKWLRFLQSLSRDNPLWISIQPSGNATFAMPSYSFTSGEDAKSRDPLAWDVSGSLNGSDWVILDERSNFTFSDRLQTADFRLAPGNASLAFSQYRFRFFETRKSSSDSLQLTGIAVPSFGFTVPKVTRAPDPILGGCVNVTNATVCTNGNIVQPEGVAAAFDARMDSKWVTQWRDDSADAYPWVTVMLHQERTVSNYTIVSGDDFSQRDPQSWVLERKRSAAEEWEAVDFREHVEWTARRTAKTFSLDETIRGVYFRWRIARIRGHDNSEGLACRMRYCTQVTSFQLE